MQTILGAGGSIGPSLARALTAYTEDIRLVSRHPKQVNPTDKLMPADLTDEAAIDKAVAGSEVVYLTIGLPYKTSVWENQWPRLVRAVLQSCERHGARLVFFDNIYSYDLSCLNHMTEICPLNPPSRKGKVRRELVTLIQEAIDRQKVQALIARSADFLGTKNSILVETVYNNLVKGRKGSWFCSLDHVHQFTYTEDAARATAQLGNTADAYGQTWHLPTDGVRRTGREWIALFAREMKGPEGARAFPAWSFSVLGLFVPVLKELKE
ncbi:MAG TPA: NAD-dependent epimerase/dehydratase family protein, partial [Chitinophagaceae bacterium]|nr:NAD-dependent epimerase/dehydratase family protein [Chitinophagaceae bacterium]